MKHAVLLLFLVSFVSVLADAQDRDQRIADLEKQLAEAKSSISVLQKTIDSLSTDIMALHQPEKGPATDVTTAAKEESGGNLTLPAISPRGSLVPKMGATSTTVT